MLQLKSNGRHKRYPYNKSPVHIFNEIIELNEVEFQGNKLIVKETKAPPRTIYSNNTFNRSSKLLEPLPNIPSRNPANQLGGKWPSGLT